MVFGLQTLQKRLGDGNGKGNGNGNKIGIYELSMGVNDDEKSGGAGKNG